MRSETKSKQELAEIKQNLWRTYRVDGKEILAPTRPKNPPEGRKLEGKDHQYPSITDYFKNKREEKQTTAKQLQDHWELMKVCVKYIEENEDWLIANRLERSYQEEERQRMWEREERLARMRKKKSEMQRKISDKNEIGTGDEKDGESSQLDRKYKKDGKGDDPDNEMIDKAWKYWHQKSPMLPGKPAPWNKLPQLRQDVQEQDDAEKLPRGRKTYNQVEGNMTVRKWMLEDIVDVDFEDFSFRKVTVEDDDDKNQIEDARRRVDFETDEIGKITREMRTRTPMKDAVRRLPKNPCQERSGVKW